MVIAVFILVHWYLAGFCQTFFLHRYASHRMFSMPLIWERFFYLVSLVSQGIICMPPKAYAIMHRMHHAYTDTDKDPHSPHIHKDPFRMAFNTAVVFLNLFADPSKSEPRFDEDCPTWPALDRLIARRTFRVLWALALVWFYVWFYGHFASARWVYVFLPVHFYMGLIHGTVANWCGHRYGYRNFESNNLSKNLACIDFFLMGESLHNNHHSRPWLPNFAAKPSEMDPTYEISKLFSRLGILQFNEKSRTR